MNRSHNLPNVVVQQSAELHVKDPIFLSDKQALVPGGAIVRNPSPSQAGAKIPINIGEGKNIVHPVQPQQSPLFSSLSIANNTPSNMETLGVKLNSKAAHLADDVSLSRISK